ncbi:MAG TPA: protein kinase [Polyangiaceae bacterium]
MLLPDEVTAAPNATQRRPKQPEIPPPARDTLDDEIEVAPPKASGLIVIPSQPPEAHAAGVQPAVPHHAVAQPPVSEIIPPGPESPSQPATDPYIGKVVAERYLVEVLLGVGSMGLVYRCRHTVLDKTVALKIIRQDLAQDDETVSRFVTEAKAASAIGSKHIVDVLDFGKLPDGATYIVMEYLEGVTLGEAMDAPGGLSIGDSLDIGVQIAEALGAAHAAGVVHRDMKPDNVFLLQSEGGYFVKVLDFGIAKVLHSGQKLTVAGSVIGTPHYMSPEQATGGRTDATTDIYSLGVMLYEMSCGKVPFDAENPLAVISMQVTDEPPPLRKRMPPGKTLPQGLESVVNKCLSKDPFDRFASMHDVQAALARIAGGGVPLVAPPSSRDHASDSLIEELHKDTDFRELRAAGRRNRWLKQSAVGLLCLAIFGAAGYGAQRWYKQRAAETAALEEAELDRRAQARLEELARKAPPPAPAPAPEPAAAAPAPEVRKVALIMFPLDAHAFEGDKDLGMMPVLLELPPGETKTISIVRRGFVTRALRVDGHKTRLVVGLVSNAVAAKRKRKGLSQEEAEAEADRAAASSAGVEAAQAAAGTAAPAALPNDKPGTVKGEASAKQAKTETLEKPPSPPPAPAGPRKDTLAPNPFGD